MADEEIDRKSQRGVSDAEEPRVRYFVERYGLTRRQAVELVREHGPDPEKAEEMVRRYRDRGG